MAVDSPLPEQEIETTVDETLGADVDWTVEETDGYRITLSDRTLSIEHRDGPDTGHWVLTLQADGAIVSKFGPFESTAELLTQLRTVLTSDVLYTVCCDGEPTGRR